MGSILRFRTGADVTSLKLSQFNYRSLITESNMNNFISNRGAANWDEIMTCIRVIQFFSYLSDLFAIRFSYREFTHKSNGKLKKVISDPF